MDVARDGAEDAELAADRLAAPATASKASAARACRSRCSATRPGARAAREAGVAVLYIHALNPYGFSWWRRTTHENVDLNRNFRDFTPAAAAQRRLRRARRADRAARPGRRRAEVDAALQRFVADARPSGAAGRRSRAASTTIPKASSTAARTRPGATSTLRHVLRDHAQRCSRLGWIDLHTGLGPSGLGERIFAVPRRRRQRCARARAWWGDGHLDLRRLVDARRR